MQRNAGKGQARWVMVRKQLKTMELRWTRPISASFEPYVDTSSRVRWRTFLQLAKEQQIP